MSTDSVSPPADLFISYAREDLEFVKALASRIIETDHTVWIDLEGIAPSAEWLEVILDNIRSSAAFAFVISPHSVVSDVCLLELGYATEVGKKIIPVLREEAKLPDVLAKLQWIPLRAGDDFKRGVDELVGALSFDLEWSRLHSRILVRAREWEKSDKKRQDLLLRGRELEQAEESRDGAEQNQRGLTPLDLEFISASRREVTAELEAAARRERSSRSRQMAAQSEHFRSSRPDQSVLLALEAASVSPTLEAKRALFHRTVDTRNVYRFLHAKNPLARVAVTHGGCRVATGGGDAFLRRGDYEITLWDSIAGRELRACGRHSSRVQFLAFTGDGVHLISASHHEAVVWDTETGNELAKLENPSAQPLAVGHLSCSMDAEGSRIATNFGDGFLVWDWRQNRTWLLPKQGWGGVDVAIHPTRTLLALADLLGKFAIALVDFETGETVAELEAPAGLRVNRMAFTPDGHSLMAVAQNTESGNEGGAMLSFELRDGEAPPLVHRYEKSLDQFDFLGGSSRLLLTRERSNLQLLDTADWRLVRKLVGHPESAMIAAVSSSGKDDVAVSCDTDGRAIIWLLGSAREIADAEEESAPLHSVAFSRDGASLVTCSAEGEFSVFAMLPAPQGHPLPGSPPIVDDAELEYSTGAIGIRECERFRLELRVARSIGANRLCVANATDQIFIGRMGGDVMEVGWDGGQIGQSLTTEMTMITAIASSSDGSLLACGDAMGAVGVWDVQSGEQLGVWEGLATAVYGLDFHPTGRILAIAPGERNRVVLWDFARAKPAEELTDPLFSGVAAVRFSPGGEHLLVGGAGIALSLWDVDERNLIGRLPSIEDGVFSLEVSPDQHYVVAGTIEGAIAILDAASGRNVGKFSVGELVTSLAFHPDGDVLAAVTQEGSLRLWDMGVVGWEHTLRRRVNRDFTEQERREFVDVSAEIDEKSRRTWSLWRGTMSLEEMAGVSAERGDAQP